jgi:organic hydroperoxide reductase OsmC/OhrA
MATPEALFQTRVRWTGSYAPGPITTRSYTRDMLIDPEGKPSILGSAGSRYLGDDRRYNPEELMLASLAECHLLTYLALTAKAGIQLAGLVVSARGALGNVEGKMRFAWATVSPATVVADAAQLERARSLHAQAHEGCFMSNSVNFPVTVEATLSVAPATP